MKDNDWLLVMVLAVGLYFLYRHEVATNRVLTPASPPNGVPPPLGTGTASGVTQSLPSTATGLSATAAAAAKSTEAAVSSYTHVPLSSVGSLAQRAPTWLKIGVFPVGITAITQDVIDNPVGSVEGAGKAIGSGAATAGKAVASAATTAAKGIASGAKAAGSAVEGAAKKVLGFL